MENNNRSGNGGGIGFCGLLTIAFIVLKLTGHIEWAWVWVLAPSWIPIAVLLILIVIGFGGVKTFDAIQSYRWERKVRTEKRINTK